MADAFSSAGDVHEDRVVVAHVIAIGTANVVTSGGRDTVIRGFKVSPTGDAFDLRVLDEDLTRSALAKTRPHTFAAPLGLPIGATPDVTVHRALTPAGRPADATEHDRQMRVLVHHQAVLVKESEEAAQILHPYQDRATRFLAQPIPGHRGLDLDEAQFSDHFAVARADVIRVATIAKDVLGEDALHAVGLPTPRELRRQLPENPTPRGTSTGPLVVAHGDPTLDNVMQDADGNTLLNDFDLAYIAPRQHAVAHTWAALTLRSSRPPTSGCQQQYFTQVPGAAQAARAGLPAAYRIIEIQRSAYGDYVRAALGTLPTAVAWRSLYRFTGKRTVPAQVFTAKVAASRERLVGVPPPTLPPGLLSSQPRSVDHSRMAEPYEKMTAQEQHILVESLLADALLPDITPPAAQAANDRYHAFLKAHLPIPPGFMPVAQLIDHIRNHGRHVSIADRKGEVLYRTASPNTRKDQTPNRHKTLGIH